MVIGLHKCINMEMLIYAKGHSLFIQKIKDRRGKIYMNKLKKEQY